MVSILNSSFRLAYNEMIVCIYNNHVRSLVLRQVGIKWPKLRYSGKASGYKRPEAVLTSVRELSCCNDSVCTVQVQHRQLGVEGLLGVKLLRYRQLVVTTSTPRGCVRNGHSSDPTT